MRTRAIAVGSERSNAVGSLELECTPEGLLIVHRGVGAFQTGYAPGALTGGTSVLVPWTSIRAVEVENDRVFLDLDRSATPHHKLLLSSFSDEDPPDVAERRRRRWIARIGLGALVLVILLLATISAVRVSTATGTGAAVLLGCLAAAVVLLAGTLAEERLGLLGRPNDSARLAFLADLSLHLPGAIVPSPSTAAASRRQGLKLPDWSFHELLPRSTTAVVISMSAALIAAVLTASWVSREPRGPTPGAVRADREPPEPVRPDPAPAPRTAAAPATSAPPLEPATMPAAPLPSAPAPGPDERSASLTGSCECRRSDSLLWRDGLPRLSMVLIDRQKTVHNRHDHLELELGVVNNGDKPIAEVSLVVRFYEKDPPPSDKRVHTFDRPVYFEGPFAPGQAIKWHVEARGNDFEVEGLPAGTLDPTGADSAPTTLLAELLRANHRPVRLHGAMMLAYLGDPRAREGALGLREALREDEAPYLDRLTWALAPVRTCAVSVSEGAGPRTVRACVWNGGSEPQQQLTLRVRGLDRPFRHTTPVEAPPLVLAETTWALSGVLPPRTGATVTVSFDPTNPDGIVPQAFEAHAE